MNRSLVEDGKRKVLSELEGREMEGRQMEEEVGKSNVG